MIYAVGTNSPEKKSFDADGFLNLSDNELSMLGAGNIITATRTTVGRFSKTPVGEWFFPGVASGLMAPAAYEIGQEIKKARS